MTRLSTFLASLVLATSGLITSVASQANNTQDILISVFGPLSQWKAIRLIDEFPDAVVDGKPANASVILRYEPAEAVTADQAAKVTELMEAAKDTSAQKRDSFGCFPPNGFVLQFQLRRAADDFCGVARSHLASFGPSFYFSIVALWRDPSGSFASFTNSFGLTTTVQFGTGINTGWPFDYTSCVLGLRRINSECVGTSGLPESKGGYWYWSAGGRTYSFLDPR